MSAGSSIVPVRIPDDLLARIDEAVSSHNRHETSKRPAKTRSEWIRHAICKALDTLRRGRNRKAKGQSGVYADDAQTDRVDLPTGQA